jgi:hypothetical protein
MTPEPAGPPPPQRPPADLGSERDRGAEPHPVERYGPVAIERYAKDDGRALLLYTHTAGRDQA